MAFGVVIAVMTSSNTVATAERASPLAALPAVSDNVAAVDGDVAAVSILARTDARSIHAAVCLDDATIEFFQGKTFAQLYPLYPKSV